MGRTMCRTVPATRHRQLTPQTALGTSSGGRLEGRREERQRAAGRRAGARRPSGRGSGPAAPAVHSLLQNPGLAAGAARGNAFARGGELPPRPVRQRGGRVPVAGVEFGNVAAAHQGRGDAALPGTELHRQRAHVQRAPPAPSVKSPPRTPRPAPPERGTPSAPRGPAPPTTRAGRAMRSPPPRRAPAPSSINGPALARAKL